MNFNLILNYIWKIEKHFESNNEIKYFVKYMWPIKPDIRISS